jgi:Ran-binding protein 1
MAEPDTMVNSPEQTESAAEPKIDKDTTEKATTDEAEDNKPATETVTDKASVAASAVKDNVFSMFGGGPKKEKREEPDDVDEPSGSSKAKKEAAEKVCLSYCISSYDPFLPPGFL